MNARLGALSIALVAATAVSAFAAGPAAPPVAALARGRALVVFGTCNDCHTAGWRESDGTLPVERWMTGSAIGFRGWWGTSYPTNVRRDFQSMSERDWVFAVRTRGGHPPMVWQDLRSLPDADLRAIYQFVRSLGSAGADAPAAVEPWREPRTPYVDMRAFPTPAPGH
jgi:mono/diheme cytochrome c family protein